MQPSGAINNLFAHRTKMDHPRTARTHYFAIGGRVAVAAATTIASLVKVAKPTTLNRAEQFRATLITRSGNSKPV